MRRVGVREEHADPRVARLQRLVRIATVSHPEQRDPGTFEELRARLRADFPLLHARLDLTDVGGHGLLAHWPGRSADRPVVLMAHSDVVPVEDGWRHDAFGAEVYDGQVWGRGTLDDKGALAAICEAVEALLAEGFTPAQDVWLSFGCDEEVFGEAAPAAVAELTRRGVRPWFVLDEGGAIAAQAFPGVAPPLGVIGVTEKGATSLLLRTSGRGGHASTPARHGPTARLARAIARLDAAPMPAHVPDPTLELFRRLGPHLPTATRVAIRPLLAAGALGRPALARLLTAAGPEAAAMARTTLAVTTLTGSPAINVIAATATAGVNARVMLGDTVDQVVAHVRRVVDDDSVEIEVTHPVEASPLSPYADDEAFALLEATVRDHFPEAVPTPYVMMAATDARHFAAICERVYRFTPFRMSKEQREAIHSYDERIGVSDYLDGIGWYRSLLERLPS